MKNLFAVDLGSEAEYAGWDKFLIRRVDEELSERQDEISEDLDEHQKNAALPGWLSIAKTLCALFSVIVLSAVIRAGFTTAMRNAPLLVICGAVSGAVALVLWLIDRKKTKNVIESKDFNADVEAAKKINEESFAALGIPADAKSIDVFGYAYETKNGKEKKMNIFCDYMTMQFKLFREGDTLCLGDVSGVVGLPLYNATGIYKIKKRVSFMEWNKDERYDKGEYKQYKITCNNAGALFIKPVYALRFRDGDDEYEIIFPAYELDAVTRATGFSVKEDE